MELDRGEGTFSRGGLRPSLVCFGGDAVATALMGAGRGCAHFLSAIHCFLRCSLAPDALLRLSARQERECCCDTVGVRERREGGGGGERSDKSGRKGCFSGFKQSLVTASQHAQSTYSHSPEYMSRGTFKVSLAFAFQTEPGVLGTSMRLRKKSEKCPTCLC